MSKFKYTAEDVRQVSREIEATHADVIQLSAAEIAQSKVVYWHARRTRFTEMVDSLNWVLGETTDNSSIRVWTARPKR